MRRPLLLANALLLLASAASAHEYWLLPDRFSAAPGEPVAIAHRVGTGWPGETLARDPARIVRFGLVDARGERAIEGAAGADPAGSIALRRPGIAFAVYRSRPSSVRLEPELFESYLRDEGLERIVAYRAAHGETQEPGVEIFARNAKALIVGSGEVSARDAQQLWRRPVGLALELVPEATRAVRPPTDRSPCGCCFAASHWRARSSRRSRRTATSGA
jgi:hypothetical protein